MGMFITPSTTVLLLVVLALTTHLDRFAPLFTAAAAEEPGDDVADSVGVGGGDALREVGEVPLGDAAPVGDDAPVGDGAVTQPQPGGGGKAEVASAFSGSVRVSKDSTKVCGQFICVTVHHTAPGLGYFPVVNASGRFRATPVESAHADEGRGLQS